MSEHTPEEIDKIMHDPVIRKLCHSFGIEITNMIIEQSEVLEREAPNIPGIVCMILILCEMAGVVGVAARSLQDNAKGVPPGMMLSIFIHKTLAGYEGCVPRKEKKSA